MENIFLSYTLQHLTPKTYFYDPLQTKAWVLKMFLHWSSSIISLISKLGIYADDTNIYSCFSNKSNKPDELNQGNALEENTQSVVNRRKK